MARAIAHLRLSSPPLTTSAPDEKPLWRKAVRVLLVDDNLVNRTIGAKQLTALGYVGEVAASARQGLAIVAAGSCDLVLMDCEMPEMDGYEAVAEIRRREGCTRHTVVIVSSLRIATAEDRARCLDAGMDDYLSKPVKLQTLGEIAGHLGARPARPLATRSNRCDHAVRSSRLSGTAP